MFRLSVLRCAGKANLKKLSPLDIFLQVQLGLHPPLNVQRSFIKEHFEEELRIQRISEGRLHGLDLRATTNLLRSLLFNRFLAVPFRLFTFDMEFTGIPNFTSEGPTEEIVEIGLYSPAHNSSFSSLVKPVKREMNAEASKLTGITQDMLVRDGVSFIEAWKGMLTFLAQPEPDELPDSDKRILLLSHGGKLADVSMLQWALKNNGLDIPQFITFGDTFHIVRDLHRRRPVTPDKHPPSWKLTDLVTWMKVGEPSPKNDGEKKTAAGETNRNLNNAHRATSDAKLTWDAIYHTLDRYGDSALTPRQQLIERFFDKDAKAEFGGSGKKSGTGNRNDDDALHFNLEEVSLD